MESKKSVLILRGVSSCGKTTLAQTIKNLVSGKRTVICCADDFFYKGGEYLFDAKKLSDAHGRCKQKFNVALNNENFEGIIIIANTNAKWGDAKYYHDKAVEKNVPCFSVIVEKRHEGDNGHCDDEIKTRQLNALTGSIKLV